MKKKSRSKRESRSAAHLKDQVDALLEAFHAGDAAVQQALIDMYNRFAIAEAARAAKGRLSK